jgi:hypothetical protein
MSRLLPAKIVAVTAVLLTVPGLLPQEVAAAGGRGRRWPGDPDGGGATSEPADGSARRDRAGKPIQVRASVEGLGDVLTLVKQATSTWNPKNPIDASAWIQAALLQFGYGPGDVEQPRSVPA